jgi:hypothetical protein
LNPPEHCSGDGEGMEEGEDLRSTQHTAAVFFIVEVGGVESATASPPPLRYGMGRWDCGFLSGPAVRGRWRTGDAVAQLADS